MNWNTLALPLFAALALSAAAAEPQSQPLTNTPAINGTNDTNVVTAPKELPEKFTNSIGMELLKVPGGYWAGKFEVTQKQFQKIMQANPSAFAGDNRPVDSVTWAEAVEFCKRMTVEDTKELKIPAGYYYVLPSESEWEALVAGGGLDLAATSQGTPRTGTAPVGSLAANSLGLCDVRGNVMEFTAGDPNLPYRVLRGGSWQEWIEINLRVEFRFYAKPDDRKNTFGFRCLLKGK